MSSTSFFYCQICNKSIQLTNKNDYIKHLEICNNNTNQFKDKDVSISINNTSTVNNNNNINIASFTFGGKQNEGVLNQMILESASFNQSFKGHRKMSEENSCINEEQKLGVGLCNKLGMHNSYINSVIQLLWNMKTIRNVIINEISIVEGNKSSFLYCLRVSTYNTYILLIYKEYI